MLVYNNTVSISEYAFKYVLNTVTPAVIQNKSGVGIGIRSHVYGFFRNYPQVYQKPSLLYNQHGQSLGTCLFYKKGIASSSYSISSSSCSNKTTPRFALGGHENAGKKLITKYSSCGIVALTTMGAGNLLSKPLNSQQLLIGLYSRPLFSKAQKNGGGPASLDFSNTNKTIKSGASGGSKSESLRRLFSLARTEWRYLAGGMLLLCVSSVVTMTIPYGIGKVIDIAFKEEDGTNSIRDYTVPVVGVMAVGALANLGRVLFFNRAAQNIVARVRINVFDSIMRQESAFFDTTPTGELVNRLSSDSQLVGSILTSNISDGLRSCAQTGVGFGMMWYMSPQLTMVVSGFVPIVGVLAIVYGRFVKKISKQVQDQLAVSTQIGAERISCINTVKSFAKEYDEIERYSKSIEKVRQLGHKEALMKSLFFGSTGFTGNMIMFMVLWYGGTMMQAGLLTVGNLTSFLMYTAWVGASVVGVSSSYSELMKGVGVSKRLFELIDRQPAIHIKGGTSIPVNEFKGNVAFNNVHFGYPTRQTQKLFAGLSLKVPAGSIIGVVGKSGLGKSTIGSLLLRFYEVEKGSITIDGYDIRDLDQQWLRKKIGLVSQDPILFSGTIYDNIAYGAPESTRDQVINAARKANAHDFIESFPDKYNTNVGERGHTLSGGQKQRIAIARALLKDPIILVLDEATSALDPTSERLVQEALEKHLLVDRTVIFITHRLNTIRNADKIAVVANGIIAEEGTYQDLCENKASLFRKLKEGNGQ